MRISVRALLAFLAAYAAMLGLHLRLLRLPYFWDEAGYYIPAALDLYRRGLLIPTTTLPEGHPPLVMAYLALVWHILGFSPWVTRAAMTLVSTATIAALYVLARRVAGREAAFWSALLLAISPLYFAQTTLDHADLAAALFTVLAVLFLVDERLWTFALAASLAVLTKETAVVLLPIAWLYAWRQYGALGKGRRGAISALAALAIPVVPLAIWSLYYHHATGYWTGNRGYLSYNLYSTLSPARIFWSFVRRSYELFIGGFNWLLAGAALAGFWWDRRHATRDSGVRTRDSEPLWRRFVFLTAGLAAIYLLLLSLVGGAILPRYLLPVFPLCYLAASVVVLRLPPFPARLILAVVAGCFIWAWQINPPYPFPYEDNLAYADYIRLHQRAAQYLEMQPGGPRVLTAWPATDELAQPFLGYVRKPLCVARVQGLAARDFADVAPGSFDLLYLYSRRWEPPGNWLERFPRWLHAQEQYFDYYPQIPPAALAAQFHLRLAVEMTERGQWVRIYSHAEGELPLDRRPGQR